MSALVSLARAGRAQPGIVDWPYGWYVVARAADVPRGAIRALRLGDRECVLYRTGSGTLRVLDAHCPHMGAHLRHGTVDGEGLRCALHGRLVDADGAVEGAGAACPKAAAWPVAERFGLVFVHFGPGAPPLPAPDDADAFAWTTARPVPIDADWRCMAVNAFDMPHLCAVHHRRLVDPLQAGVDDGRAWLRYVSQVSGGSPSDRVMKLLSRDRIRVRMSCFGTVILAETDLGFTRTAAVLGMLPVGGGLRAHGAFGIRPGAGLPLRLWLTRLLFTAFLRRDFEVVGGMRLRIDETDPGLRVLSGYLHGLPGVRA